MATRSYQDAGGNVLQRKLFSSVASEDVFEFGDLTAHGKLDAINAKLPALSSSRVPTTGILTATSPSDYSQPGTLASGVIKASSGQIFSLSCTNLNASIRYLQLFDRATTPSGATNLIRSFPVYGNGGFLVLGSDVFGSVDSGIGLFFATGIAWGFSTAPLTFTAGTATDCIFAARWL